MRQRPMFKKMNLCKNQDKFDVVLKNFFQRTGNEMTDQRKWTPSGALFFILTLSTSLGYGNLHPITTEGKMFTIVFSLVSIPLMGYCLALVAGGILSLRKPTESLFLACATVFTGFLAGGALLFSFYFEPTWSLVESLYFSACTLMTVGFGDYAPTNAVSKIFTVFYVLAGLGVASTFIALLTRKVDQKIRENI